jgi:O-acetylhomoserine/O-acetylserine sulfhydrylase-like pyridoxal-dependent enzyme
MKIHRMNNDKIPQTDSIEELARFWDTHDLTDFADEIEEDSETVFERETVVSVHLRCEEAEAVENIAKSQGVNPSDLIHQWVLEKVQATP